MWCFPSAQRFYTSHSALLLNTALFYLTQRFYTLRSNFAKCYKSAMSEQISVNLKYLVLKVQSFLKSNVKVYDDFTLRFQSAQRLYVILRKVEVLGAGNSLQ